MTHSRCTVPSLHLWTYCLSFSPVGPIKHLIWPPLFTKRTKWRKNPTIKSFMNVGQACELNNRLSDRRVLFSLTLKSSFFHIPLLSLIKSFLGGWWSGDHGVEPVFQVILRHLLPDRSRLGRCDVFVFRLLHLLFYHLLHVLTPWRLKEHMVSLTIIYVLTCLII